MKNFEALKYEKELTEIFKEISNSKKWDTNSLQKILKRSPKDGNRLFRKDELVAGYRKLKMEDPIIEGRIRLKPTRTNSGVTTVTVLTKPFGCPGNCIYCPNDPSMPKSYISSEPGAQRALTNHFDPYAQVYNRLVALQNIGHSIEKVELIVLGGTWSFYPPQYQRSFIYECFRALNDVNRDTREYIEPRESMDMDVKWKDIEDIQKINETAFCRNVGLVLETRPDYITIKEAGRMRRLGATKVQIGVQTLSDGILKKNNIGRNNNDTVHAFEILRLFGFKIHIHWMPNLYGSTPKKDVREYMKLWGKKYCPDELKIYPTSIIPNTTLHELYLQGKYRPYTEEELEYVLMNILPKTPRYCRLTRIIRDIPSDEIVEGNKKTNLRQIIEKKLKEEHITIEDIRSREIKGEKVEMENLELEIIQYKTTVSEEYFLSYRTKDTDRLCGFLRLSLPKKEALVDELKNSSIIREVHVYGRTLGLGDSSTGESQHLGLGTKLLKKAEEISKRKGYEYTSVISATGTREYYKNRGYEMGVLYMKKESNKNI